VIHNLYLKRVDNCQYSVNKKIMTLKDFIDRERLSQRQFALRAGLSVSAVSRLINGSRKPSVMSVLRIVDATSGEVTANDFFEKKN
tara:strand:- start:159 stop:416 length:258 start_codon:yes stop_codon:yes gene_type:complete